MEPKKVGRTLGIGVRVASNMLRERVERAAASSPPTSTAENGPPPASTPRRSVVPVGSRVKNAKRGAKAFGQALLGPFTHAGSVLWLEVEYPKRAPWWIVWFLAISSASALAFLRWF